jgi:hypothetical protein
MPPTQQSASANLNSTPRPVAGSIRRRNVHRGHKGGCFQMSFVESRSTTLLLQKSVEVSVAMVRYCLLLAGST